MSQPTQSSAIENPTTTTTISSSTTFTSNPPEHTPNPTTTIHHTTPTRTTATMLETLPELPSPTSRPQRPLTPPSSGSATPTLRPRLIDYDGLCAPATGTRARLHSPPQPLHTALESATTEILSAIGEDPTRPGLLGTPDRFARALLASTSGYGLNIHDVVHGALFPEESEDMILIRDIDVASTCEHHLLPFFGVLHIGYIPSGKVLGLSKFARIAEMFALRLQIQERLTRQVADACWEVLEPRGLAVVLEMRHACLSCRGVRQGGARATTSCMRGVMRSRDRTRREFLALLRER